MLVRTTGGFGGAMIKVNCGWMLECISLIEEVIADGRYMVLQWYGRMVM